MPPAFDDMPNGIPFSELRRHHWSSQSRHRHLSSVCMAGDRQSDPVRDFREHIRIVRDDDDRARLIHACERAADIMRRFPKVADACQPKRPPVTQERDRTILQHRTAFIFERFSYTGPVKPPIVSPSDGIHSQGRLQRSQDPGACFGFDKLPAHHTLDHEIPGQQDKVRMCAIGGVHHLLQFVEIVMR